MDRFYPLFRAPTPVSLSPMHPQLFVILLLLTAAVGAVSVVRRLKLPSMLAYLAIGMALGPHGLALLKAIKANPALHRKLLRLWLKMPNARKLAPEFPGRNGFPG